MAENNDRNNNNNNGNNNIKAERWWHVWLDELESGKPNVERAANAARHLTAAKPSQAQMQQWLAAIGGDDDDPLTCGECQARLPDFLTAQAAGSVSAAPFSAKPSVEPNAEPNDEFRAVRIHLAQCPYCTAAYAQSAELLAASLRDSIPVSPSYPAFDLAFLSGPAPAAPIAAGGRSLSGHIEAAVMAGRRWLRESNGFLILFGAGLQSEPGSAWGVKSANDGTLLAQLVLSEEEMDGWEVTIAAFAQEAATQKGEGDLCQLELALYRPDRSLAGISVRMVVGAEEFTKLTDSGGVAIFNNITVGQLGDVIVHVAL